MLDRLKVRADGLKTEVMAIYFAYRDPRTPWLAKVLALLVAAYALSPIDLIPDFIPVLGYLDDLIIVPAGIALVLRMIPEEIMARARGKALTLREGSGGIHWLGALIVVLAWLVLLLILTWLVLQNIHKPA
jgi:uncharacterized membrane protein YkvA (DUF1232 family)